MIKALFLFGLLFAGFWIGIPALRTLSGQEKWDLTKTAVYAILCAVLTLLVLFSIWYIF